MVKIGLKKAYVAKMLTDIAGTSVTYDVPVSLLAVQQAAVNPRVSSVQVPGDDIIQEDLSECLGADGTIQRKEMTPAEEAMLLGRITDNDGGVYGGNFDDAPYFALGYMRTFKGSNVGLYVWILKTKFRPSNSTADTKPVDNITPQYDSLSFSSITREADGAWIYSIKSSDPNFVDTFFTQATLQKLVAATVPSALEISSIVPADEATNVSVDANIVLTFNNKIAYEFITVIAEDGTLISGIKSWDAAHKVLTFNPTSNLTASTTYIVVISGVTDSYGQTLEQTTKKFITAV